MHVALEIPYRAKAYHETGPPLKDDLERFVTFTSNTWRLPRSVKMILKQTKIINDKKVLLFFFVTQ